MWLLSALGAQAQTDSELIRAVISDETDAFYARDKARWSSAWVHKSYVSLTASLHGGNFLLLDGWEKIEKQFAGYFSRQRKGEPVQIQHDNFSLHQNGNMAFVTYDQTLSDNRGRTASRESRVLERINGQWKLVSVVAISRLREFTLAQSAGRH